MEKSQQNLFSIIYYPICKWNNITIKDVNSSQICKFNWVEQIR